jgi:SMODS-associated and fused to various effectors sensor domain
MSVAVKSRARTSRSYTDRTLKLLWGRAAGRCAMPECRVELFAEATDYDPVVVIGEIAHVAGAADAGPRAAPKLASAQRNDYGNLILLCQNCHARIDGQTGFYAVAKLKDIKQAHEAWVRASLPERGRSRTGWTVLALRGDHALDLGTAAEALAPDFILGSTQVLQVPTDAADWQAVDAVIAASARQLLAREDNFDRRIAVFPLAPVSACISLGYHLTSRPHVRLFQHHRDERSWAWPRRLAPAQDIVVTGLDGNPRHAPVATFLFHYSAAILDDVLTEVGVSLDFRVDFRVPQPSTGWLQHPDQLTWAALEARRAFERAMQLAPRATEWRLFYAGPAPLAVAIGQQLNPTMYPPVQLYEYRHKETPQYKPTIWLDAP